MADIFISYSKDDREIVVRMATLLEAEGWSVWWDKGLSAGDTYRDEIMRELTSARAVISVWTKTSVKSDWVRAEAGRAKADNKLIPIKSAELGYSDIPLPFGEMHTENLGSDELIRAAVVAQLAKPQVQASTTNVASALIRYEVLTWIGVAGGAITLLGNLKGIISLADWVNLLVSHWSHWSHAFWHFFASFIGIVLSPIWTPILNFLLFFLAIVLGTAMAQRRRLKTIDTATNRPSLSQSQFDLLIIPIGVLSVVIGSTFSKLNVSRNLIFGTMNVSVAEAWCTAVVLIVFLAVFVAWRATTDKFGSTVFVVLFSAMFFLIVLVQVTNIASTQRVDRQAFLLTPVSSIFVGPCLAALMSFPAYLLNRRLLSSLIGLGLLLALNELSKLHLGQILR